MTEFIGQPQLPTGLAEKVIGLLEKQGEFSTGAAQAKALGNIGSAAFDAWTERKIHDRKISDTIAEEARARADAIEKLKLQHDYAEAEHKLRSRLESDRMVEEYRLRGEQADKQNRYKAAAEKYSKTMDVIKATLSGSEFTRPASGQRPPDGYVHLPDFVKGFGLTPPKELEGTYFRRQPKGAAGAGGSSSDVQRRLKLEQAAAQAATAHVNSMESARSQDVNMPGPMSAQEREALWRKQYDAAMQQFGLQEKPPAAAKPALDDIILKGLMEGLGAGQPQAPASDGGSSSDESPAPGEGMVRITNQDTGESKIVSAQEAENLEDPWIVDQGTQ